ncbi:MAG: fibronectin type III domain-containing protein, partial [Thaumarchaeota archaeon]|nr:fibronectin type III domain-containing protein [Nitrososphaerota archaeon]
MHRVEKTTLIIILIIIISSSISLSLKPVTAQTYLIVSPPMLKSTIVSSPTNLKSTITPLVTNLKPTSLSPPTNLKATTVSSTQINLSWISPTHNTNYATIGYKIERSINSSSAWITIVNNTTTNSTVYSDKGLGSGITYTYRVSAINTLVNTNTLVNGFVTSTASNTASATTFTAPGAPTGLIATTISSSQINLSWMAPTNNGGAT